MSKLSFQQLLFITFLTVTVLLGAAAVQALLTVERLANQSREAALAAVRLTEEAETLSERTVAMERSARQYLVLDDAAFRDRYTQARQEAGQALQALAAGMPVLPSELTAQWVAQSDTVWHAMQSMQAGNPRNPDDERMLTAAFARLPRLNLALAQESKREIARRNDSVLQELERQRRMLGVLVAAALVSAAVVTLGAGTWLSRPLARIEAAIEKLGDNQFEQPIEVDGPADMRRLGTQLNWLRQRLAELEADKTRFLRHVSHELKTPLAALCEGVASLEDEVAGKLTPSQREVTGILRQNTLSLQTQIEDLLRYNAATFGAQHLERRAVDVERLLQQIIADQRLQWQARKLKVEVRKQGAHQDGAGDKMRTLSADADKLRIALANLLSNALRFSPDGGTVYFLLNEQAQQLTIDCIDQGAGVAPGDAARVFEPFFQGVRQPSGARQGNGIGLSIVREYVHAHGGTVSLLNERSRDVPSAGGAHFRIVLPYDS